MQIVCPYCEKKSTVSTVLSILWISKCFSCKRKIVFPLNKWLLFFLFLLFVIWFFYCMFFSQFFHERWVSIIFWISNILTFVILVVNYKNINKVKKYKSKSDPITTNTKRFDRSFILLCAFFFVFIIIVLFLDWDNSLNNPLESAFIVLFTFGLMTWLRSMYVNFQKKKTWKAIAGIIYFVICCFFLFIMLWYKIENVQENMKREKQQAQWPKDLYNPKDYMFDFTQTERVRVILAQMDACSNKKNYSKCQYSSGTSIEYGKCVDGMCE